MLGTILARNESIPEALIVSAQIYLGTCGALEDHSLLLNKAFAEQMLENALEGSGEPYGRIDDDMQCRAVEYFRRYRDPDDSMAIAYPHFVEGLLSYALLGIDTNDTGGEYGESVVKFPGNR